ncbi:MAG: hypothetical protein RLZ37_2118 [Actinomycetota bacterium]|jgi:hypothetical protein
MSDQSDIENIRERVQDLIVSLDDVTFTLLRRASRESGTRPASDKTLVQARRALEKAARLLGSLDVDAGDSDSLV